MDRWAGGHAAARIPTPSAPPTFDAGFLAEWEGKALTQKDALVARQKAVDQQLQASRLTLDTRTENRRQGAEGRAETKAQREEREAAEKVPARTGDSALNVAIERLMQQRGLTGRPPTDVLQQAEQDIVDGKVRVSSSQGASQIVQTPDGYFRVNPRSGAVERVEGPTGATLQPKPTTEEQRAGSFADRANQAHDIALQLEQKGVQPTPATEAAKKLPYNLGNYLLPAEQQQYQQAILQFTQNLLRKESGAAISQSEYDATNKTYFPQPGEGPEVIKQKQEARTKVLEEPASGKGPGRRPRAGRPRSV